MSCEFHPNYKKGNLPSREGVASEAEGTAQAGMWAAKAVVSHPSSVDTRSHMRGHCPVGVGRARSAFNFLEVSGKVTS